MPLRYWCEKCQDFVTPHSGVFPHPDLGMKTCLFCAKHLVQVYLKEDNREKV